MYDLIIHSLLKSFKTKTVLKDVSLKCETGRILGLFGRNGSGKSTLIKILTGHVKADAMVVSVNNQLLKSSGNRSGIFAYLPQGNFIPGGLKLSEVIQIYHQDERIQKEILYDKMIAQLMDQRISSLSLGERRYFEVVLLAKLKQPFLLLDEPFSMVEPLYRESLKEILLKEKHHKGIIITDHYFQDVLAISDHHILLKEGKSIPVINKEDLVINNYLPEQ